MTIFRFIRVRLIKLVSFMDHLDYAFYIILFNKSRPSRQEAGRLEGEEAGKLEGWEVGRPESWKA